MPLIRIEGLKPEASVGPIPDDRVLAVLPIPNGPEKPIIIQENADNMGGLMGQVDLSTELILETGDEASPETLETISVKNTEDVDRVNLENSISTLNSLKLQHAASIKLFDKLSGDQGKQNRETISVLVKDEEQKRRQIEALQTLYQALIS